MDLKVLQLSFVRLNHRHFIPELLLSFLREQNVEIYHYRIDRIYRSELFSRQAGYRMRTADYISSHLYITRASTNPRTG